LRKPRASASGCRRGLRGGFGYESRLIPADRRQDWASVHSSFDPAYPLACCRDGSPEPNAMRQLFARLERAWRERAVVLKAASFAMIGVVNAAVDLAVFLAAYDIAGVPLVP